MATINRITGKTNEQVIAEAQAALARSKSVLEQTRAEGSKPFAGSVYNRYGSVPILSALPVDRTIGIGKLGTSQEELAKASSLEAAQKYQQEASLYAAQQRQARIDAINQMFAPRITREKEEGLARTARVEALSFKRGLVGSGAETTKLSEQRMLNEKAIQAIEDEKALLINEAFTQADKLATERAALLIEQAKGAAQANVDLYTAQAEKAIDTIKKFGASGKTLEEIKAVSPDTIQTLRDVSGLDEGEIRNLLMVSAPEGTYQWGQAYKTGNKLVVPKQVGNKITLETIQAPEGVDFDDNWQFNRDVGFYNVKTQQIKPIEKPENVFTLDEVGKLGLPGILVGMSEKQVLGQLQQNTPPPWFITLSEQKLRQSLRPQRLSELWSDFREKMLDGDDGDGNLFSDGETTTDEDLY